MKKKFDFKAVLKYRTADEGGRKTPANSGYRPQLKFKFTEMQTSGYQHFIGTNIVNPGETITALIGMSTTNYYENKLKVGMEFEFREGEIIIGIGKIIEIMNESLEQKTAST